MQNQPIKLHTSYIQIIIPYGSNTLPIKTTLPFTFKVKQHGQQQLYLQYKVYWILYKMVGALSFSQPYLCIQPTLQSPPKNRSSASVNFHLPIPPLLIHKIIFTIPTNIPFLYTSAIFHFPHFAYNQLNNLLQEYFPYINYFTYSGFLIPSTYCHYFQTLLIPEQELTFLWKPVAWLDFHPKFSIFVH